LSKPKKSKRQYGRSLDMRRGQHEEGADGRPLRAYPLRRV
jgi:hypothetical protein